VFNQHAERIEQCRIQLQHVAAGVEEGQLHEALGRVALDGA
jgi:hypothetical protein